MHEDGQMMFEENIETATNYVLIAVEDFMFTVLSPYAIHCVPGIEKMDRKGILRHRVYRHAKRRVITLARSVNNNITICVLDNVIYIMCYFPGYCVPLTLTP
nr:hypothetical protein Iba_chr06cCG13710 [Ipomoea batatas]